MRYFGSDFLLDNPNCDVNRRRHSHGETAQNIDGVDIVVNLACISNDASFELDENLSTSINLNAFEPMVLAAKDAGVKRFVYASSSSPSTASPTSQTSPKTIRSCHSRSIISTRVCASRS